MLVKNSLRGQGIRLIEPTSADFQGELAQLLEPTVIAQIAPILPFSIIVVNDTNRYLYSFTVVYTYPNRIAPAGTPWRVVTSPTASTPDDRKAMVAPGDHYLITPITDIIPSRNAAGKRGTSPYFDEGMERVVALFQADDAKQQIDASVDSVIFEDGRLIGDDSVDRVAKINARMRAERDLVAGLQTLSGTDLQQRLFSEVKATSENRDYAKFKTRAANYILRVLNNRGEPAALEAVRQLSGVKWFANSEGVRKVE